MQRWFIKWKFSTGLRIKAIRQWRIARKNCNQAVVVYQCTALRYKIYKITLRETLVTRGGEKNITRTPNTAKKRKIKSCRRYVRCHDCGAKRHATHQSWSNSPGTTEERLSDSNSEKKGLEHQNYALQFWEKLAEKLTWNSWIIEHKNNANRVIVRTLITINI